MSATNKTLTKENASRESEGKRTTAIRPVSLRRAQITASHLGVENVTDFISNAVDLRVRALVKKHRIALPSDAAFESA
jgi:hypothetical protein